MILKIIFRGKIYVLFVEQAVALQAAAPGRPNEGNNGTGESDIARDPVSLISCVCRKSLLITAKKTSFHNPEKNYFWQYITRDMSLFLRH